MNLIDTSANSPHHFFWKHTGTRNENNNKGVEGWIGTGAGVDENHSMKVTEQYSTFEL